MRSGPWAALSIPDAGGQHCSQFCHLETDVCGKTAKLQVRIGEDLNFLLAMHMLSGTIGVPCFLATPNGLRLEDCSQPGQWL